MAITRLRMRVELDDGTTWEVDTDQRDNARFELQDFYAPHRVLLRQRFMAYVASCRAGKTSLPWPKFDAACIEVVGVDTDEVGLDPTPPDQSDDPSSI